MATLTEPLTPMPDDIVPDEIPSKKLYLSGQKQINQRLKLAKFTPDQVHQPANILSFNQETIKAGYHEIEHNKVELDLRTLPFLGGRRESFGENLIWP